VLSRWSLAQSRSPELMDDPSLDAHEHLTALRALGTINALSLTASTLGRAITTLAASASSVQRPFRVVDVACGGGDVTVALARRLGPAFRIVGIDMSRRAVERASGLAARQAVPNASFEACDVLAAGCPACDVVVTSLFLHHLDDGMAAAMVQRLADAASVGGVVSDLVRSRRGLVLAHLATCVLTRSRVARIDGPLSVRAARTLPEYRRLMQRAGLPEARIVPTWPERVLITWRRSSSGVGR